MAVWQFRQMRSEVVAAFQLRGVSSTFDIFIGGPMTVGELDVYGQPIDQHLGNLEKAVRLALDALISETPGLEGLKYSIQIGQGLGAGLISSRVFDMIDEADFAIFDLSGICKTQDGKQFFGNPSPNTVYELALAHSLGVYTLPIFPKRHEEFFYMSNMLHLAVDSFDVKYLFYAIKEEFRKLLKLDAVPEPKDRDPISAHYGMALVDVSSATGLAISYFEAVLLKLLSNGTRRQIFGKHEGSGIENCKINKLLLVEPMTFNGLDGQILDLDVELKSLGCDHRELTYKPPAGSEHARDIKLRYCNGYIYDLPTVLRSMKSSPRYERISQLISEIHGPDSTRNGERIKKREAEIIGSFFKSLGRLVRTRVDTSDALVEIVPKDEFVKRMVAANKPS